ncbi:uncharacterized protein LOC132308904 [Cornus florida]|uniref:uncharacterized protein LOC132308904 n=1 Tax=Cornus florida TaxID=4283 RepID=UPI0028A1D875|nr:uncharacterized protein LOC132308904 [Cornus florida]
MDEPVKGTVTPLSSIFPAGEAQKASKRVHDTITERQKELDQVREFIADNTNLVNLVQKLPDELHHDIMVPFGKAAFFPGRVIHTNEFLVLLGEGYYAERTSKQTIEILKRRGKVLESQVESLKSIMQDLKAEASFFDATVAEAAEGLVEISEEYTEEVRIEDTSKAGPAQSDSPRFSKKDNMKAAVEGEEYAHMMSRIDELEKPELAAEGINGCDEDEEYARMMSRMDELENEEFVAETASECDEDGKTRANFGHSTSQQSLDDKCQNSEGHQLSNQLKQSKDEHTSREDLLSKSHGRQKFSDRLNFDGLKVQHVSEVPQGECLALYKPDSTEKAAVLPELKENVRAAPTSTKEAFTGSIIEHPHNIEKNRREQTEASSKSTTGTSKPVSRFKMQRR